MPRPRIPAGEVGAVQITKLADGRYRARGRMRGDAGVLRQLRATADTKEGALAELRQVAAQFTSNGEGALTGASTIAAAADAWLLHVTGRADAGSLAYSTLESYETTVRLILKPACGGIALDQLTVGRADRIIRGIFQTGSLSEARRARAVLGLICGYAVRDDAIPHNPVRDVQRLPMPEKKTSVLTAVQVSAIRGLMHRWRATGGPGPRPNYRALIDGMDIMLATSARVGECIGLRRKDVDMTSSPPTLLVDGTIVHTKKQGLHRKNAPKRARQRRRVALPAMAATAVRSRLTVAGPGEEAYLFPTSTGRPMSVSNYERLLRTFVEDTRAALIALEVDVEEYSTHLYRRTTATLVERAAGITLASRLLGHANEQITRASYVVSAVEVDPITIDILDEVLGF